MFYPKRIAAFSIFSVLILFFSLSAAFAKTADELIDEGVAYYQQGNYDDAITQFTIAIAISPNSLEAYNNRGNAYDAKGNHEQAIADYSKVIDINPFYGWAYYNRAVAYSGKKDYDKAWDDIHKAEALGHSSDPEFLNDLGRASGREK
ncbi:MAG: tetratricopeptide repeat protein [Candidatus Omnitrophica bacterium]|nr:tetratricopeptide repeat protein [Candidatus Omnitrophota bacterium]